MWSQQCAQTDAALLAVHPCLCVADKNSECIDSVRVALLRAASAEPAKTEAATPVKAAEEAAETGGSPLAPILGTVAGIVLVAIAAFSSNAASAEAYEASKKEAEAKTKVEAGEHNHTCPKCLQQFFAAEVNAICLACQQCCNT